MRGSAVVRGHALPRCESDTRPSSRLSRGRKYRGTLKSAPTLAGTCRDEAPRGDAAHRGDAESADPGEISTAGVRAGSEAQTAAGEPGDVGIQPRTTPTDGNRDGGSALGRSLDT